MKMPNHPHNPSSSVFIKSVVIPVQPWSTFLFMLALTGAISAAESKIIAPDETLQKLASNFTFTEGPAADSEGNVFFTDQPNDRILKWSIDGKLSTFMQPC